jgi:hypothetical protein
MAFPEDGAMDGVSDHEKGTTVTDHPFRARGEWWTVCETCGLARAAHSTTTHVEGGAHAHSDAT